MTKFRFVRLNNTHKSNTVTEAAVHEPKASAQRARAVGESPV